MPTTPRTPYPWDLEQTPSANFQQPQEQHLQIQHQPPQPSPTDVYEQQIQPPNPPLQTIQLEEHVPIVRSQRREDYERERSSRRVDERPDGQHKPRICVDTTSSSSAAGGGPVRLSPTASRGYHPYRRAQSGDAAASGSGSRSRRDTEQQPQVRFAGQGQPQGSMSAPSARSRITSLGSTIGATRCATFSPRSLSSAVRTQISPRSCLLSFEQFSSGQRHAQLHPATA